MLAAGDDAVSSWDLAGRPYALVRESGTYRRALDGRFLRKREATADGPRVRERLTAAGGAPVVAAARDEATAALRALEAAGGAGEAVERLRAVVAMDEAALARDAARFLAVCGPVGILPPDQYLSLVVRITEGCSWDACTFCSLYEGMPFRVRTHREVARHVDALQAYFGASIALRRAVFLGDANALSLPPDRLLPLLDTVAEAFSGRPLYSFVDAWTGSRKAETQWRACRERGLRRVYVGLETGDPRLLERLGKPGAPEDAVRLVASLHDAGVAAGVIVLLGAAGADLAEAHVRGTADVLAAMRLGRDDIVYFSEYVSGAARRTGSANASATETPGHEAVASERRAIASAFLGAHGGEKPRLASYDLREFTY